jgi:hypothetical protein
VEEGHGFGAGLLRGRWLATRSLPHGSFLVRLDPGARIQFDETRVNDEVWLPRHISVAASARLGIFKKLRVQEDTTYKSFRKFQSDSRLVAVEQPH